MRKLFIAAFAAVGSALYLKPKRLCGCSGQLHEGGCPRFARPAEPIQSAPTKKPKAKSRKCIRDELGEKFIAAVHAGDHGTAKAVVRQIINL